MPKKRQEVSVGEDGSITMTEFRRRALAAGFRLKRFSWSPRLSQETNAFAADLWFKGAKLAAVGNDGGGGCNNIDLHPDKAGRHVTARDVLDGPVGEFLRGQPMLRFDPRPGDDPAENAMRVVADLDHLVDVLVEREIDLKEWKRMCGKGNTVFRLRTDKAGEYRVHRMPFTPAVAAHIRGQFGDKLEEILNERLAEAVEADRLLMGGGAA